MAAARAARLAAAAALALAAPLGAQPPATPAPAPPADGGAPLARALQLETEERYRDAVPLFRAALRDDLAGAVLGLERVLAALGDTPALLPLADSLVAAHPDEALVRTVQLRALTMAGDDARARAAFEAWAARRPTDAQPYRDYARLLLEGGRAALADTVLGRARTALGHEREVAYELAQLRARQERWGEAAASWRLALAGQDYLFQAAIFALQPAPAGERAAVRAALLAPPVALAARRAAAWLELGWGDAAAGWRALAALPARDSAVEAWVAFAAEAEGQGAWAVAVQALAAAHRARPGPALAARAADAALQAGDAEGALALAAAAARDGAAGEDDRALLPIQVRALSRLGRPGDAAALVAEAARRDPALAAPLQRELAWAWIRAGELERAQAALVRGGVEPDDELHGWLALYRGDLATARAQLRAGAEGLGGDAVAALALLVRTSAERAPEAGEAFLALARGDSARAAEGFEAAAAADPSARALLLALAARLHAGRGDDARAVALWERLVADHAASPEAPEAELAWARLLRARGDHAGAAARLEHLILTHPTSALLPQARRELERAAPPRPPATPAAASAPPPAP